MILRNKNVLITGATGGLGSALASEFVKNGSNLFLTGTDSNKLEQLTVRLQNKNTLDGKIKYEKCDLSNEGSVLQFIEKVKFTFGYIDVLVNCAGVFPVKSLTDTSLEEHKKCIQVNLNTPFILTKAFSQDMIKNKWGRIINIASSSAYAGGPLTSTYCASKHGLLGLSRSLYQELKTKGVRVMTVSPGSIKTEMGREVEKLGQTYDTFMEPSEIANYIVYNASFDGNLVCEELRLNRLEVR